MSNNILFIFEGAKTEVQIIQNLQKFFVNENLNIHCIFGGEIYQIFKEIKADENLDTFNLLKERSPKNEEVLKNYTRDDFAEIYLFFDYDGHSKVAHDVRLRELLDFFSEETDKGKLYISYPMVEALKHISDFDEFKDSCVSCKKNMNYKKIVSDESQKHLIDFKNYDVEIWKLLISTHLKKMNYLCDNKFLLPIQLFTQSRIFSDQITKYITPHSKVAVLSSFPVFVHDYYGNENTLLKIR